MFIEHIQWENPGSAAAPEDQTGDVIVTGVVRGRGLKADRLACLGDWGDYRIAKITAAPLSKHAKARADQMAVDQAEAEDILDEPTDGHDDLDELAPEEAVMQDLEDTAAPEAVPERKGVLLDDHHYFSDDNSHMPPVARRLPKGTSAYQAVWILDDIPVSDSEDEIAMDDDGDLAMQPPALPQDGVEGLDARLAPTETAPSEAPQPEMFLDPAPEDEADQLAAFRKRGEKEAQEDLEFPDEIELHPNVLARERLARYRGLKSLRISHWEAAEDRPHEPAEWRRLLQVLDPKSVKNQVTREALVGGVKARPMPQRLGPADGSKPGLRVRVHLREVPLRLRGQSGSEPLALYSLLRHEHKAAVVNFSISLGSDQPGPIRSKDELVLQCGPRRLVIEPLFSQAGHTPNNVHKFARYLHPGRTAVATFIAPVTWGSVPALVFRRASPDASLELIGTGTSLQPDHSRVLAKRVILTGHPYKIHKKLVTVRYMFFNAEDVAWFKALQLWTKRGRSGYIKESLGTHGYFKATFDAKINPQDSVGVSLYKRVFPRRARAWTGEDTLSSRTT